MVHTFPKGICQKVIVIAQEEFELAYYDSRVYHFNHNSINTKNPKKQKYKNPKMAESVRTLPLSQQYLFFNNHKTKLLETISQCISILLLNKTTSL